MLCSFEPREWGRARSVMPEGTEAGEHGDALELGGESRPVEVSLAVSWLKVLLIGDRGRESKG